MPSGIVSDIYVFFSRDQTSLQLPG